MIRGPEVLQEYIGIPYYYHQSNEKISNGERALAFEEGINCFNLVHLTIEKMHGVKLPTDMMPKEMLEDEEFFRTVDLDSEIPEPLDVFIFGRENLDYLKLHPTIFTGEKTPEGDLQLVHASFFDGVVCTWQLEKFSKFKRYKILYAVKRIKIS